MKYSTCFTHSAREIEITAYLEVTWSKYVTGHNDSLDIDENATVKSIDDIEIESLTIDGEEIAPEFFHLWEKIAIEQAREEMGV